MKVCVLTQTISYPYEGGETEILGVYADFAKAFGEIQKWKRAARIEAPNERGLDYWEWRIYRRKSADEVAYRITEAEVQ